VTLGQVNSALSSLLCETRSYAMGNASRL
jgi:hypothetical protein